MGITWMMAITHPSVCLERSSQAVTSITTSRQTSHLCTASRAHVFLQDVGTDRLHRLQLLEAKPVVISAGKMLRPVSPEALHGKLQSHLLTLQIPAYEVEPNRFEVLTRSHPKLPTDNNHCNRYCSVVKPWQDEGSGSCCRESQGDV